MVPRYVVLGCGRQGTAAAYDLVRFGVPSTLILADVHPGIARSSLQKIRRLLSQEILAKKIQLKAVPLDVQSSSKLDALLKGSSGVLSALPYYLNFAAAKAAVKAKADYCDLGGYLQATQQILGLDRLAKQAKVTLVPDCGLAPGFCTTLSVCGMGHLDITKEVKVYCGGLPQIPRPPLGYKIVYNLEGLLGIYFSKAYVLRKGKVEQISTFSEYEELDFPGLGRLESFVTAGGTSTCPWTFENRLRVYEYKTLRYPGHFEKVKFLKDLGFFEEKPMQADGFKISPRKLFMELVGPRLAFPEDKDLVALRVCVRGTKNGQPMELVYDVLDFHDDRTGFSAMERTTGFSAAVVFRMLVQDRIKVVGALPVETAVPARPFIDEIRRRGIKIQETIRNLASV